jgi:predicted enzyme related to lactoylglutathione lyase
MTHGRVVNFEIPADDLDRAQTFYQKAFGWTANLIPEVGYVNLGTGPSDVIGRHLEPNGINGGMATRGGPITAPLVTVYVDDIDAALEQVVELGGRVVQAKIAVFDFGFRAYFADTEGNILGLWQDLRPGDVDYERVE